MKRTLSLIMMAGLLAAATLRAQVDNTQTITKTGTTVAQFLKIGVDARGTAMGGAFAAMAGDLSAMYWNPAGLGHYQGLGTMFVHNQWLADMNFNYAAVAFEVRGLGTLGLSVTSLSAPDDFVRTVERPEGTGELFDANDLALGLTYARRLTDRFAIGGTAKFIRQNLWHMSANAVALDIGALFTTPFRNVRLGASISNFGSDLRLDGRDIRFSNDPDPTNEGNVEFVNAMYETEKFPLPLSFRVGLATEIYQNDNVRVTVGLDALHPNDNAESINTGAEVVLNEMLFLRGGYSTLFRSESEEGLTLGGGLHYRLWGSSTKLKIDYAYADFGLLENVQRFSLGVNF
ncbi:PorV/PorQ family protein [candidate division KSB1 bacterium]|nr:PorV/PorQ family protein [bacterium]NUM64216.1 PorV/PorQ family protein [candidate division KSB1 bacterium]